MIPLSSKLESSVKEFVEVKNMLEERNFALGGAWDYEHGSFDRYLDEAHKVWLRMPFQVINGNADSETGANDAKIRLGTPYVLKHVYNEGNDSAAHPKMMGGLIDQFQKPVDPDAEIEPEWVEKAERVLGEVERLFTH